jgi:uncharacterized protein YdhG (YjbR/CyaY superfamily)
MSPRERIFDEQEKQRTQQLKESVERAIREATPEIARKFLSQLSMYDENGKLKSE